ncbi:MAG: ABC transporter ATP-binding protein, partial [Chitinophagaceae bacterium]
QMNQMKIIERIQQKVFVRYSFAFTTHIPKLDLQAIDGYYLPELVNRFFDIPVLQKSLSKILLDFPLAITQIILGLLLLSFYHPAFIFFGMLLLLLLVLIFRVTGNKGFQTSLEKSTYKYRVAGWLEEMARVVKQFKFSAHNALHEKKADHKVVHYIEARKAHFSILLLQYKVLIAFKVIITAAMLIVGCLLLLDQQINIGQFVAAEIVIIIVINAVEKLITNLDSVYSALTSVEKINKLLDKPAEKSGSFMAKNGQAFGVQFNNVSFGYQDDRTILHRISFAVKAGEKISITGKSGSGKSTILKLLTGAYEGFNGSVLINDVPIGNYNLEYLRSQTGIVLSQQDVFAGTLWENITLGDDNIDAAYIAML